MATNKTDIERKIRVFKLFSTNGYLSNFDQNRTVWSKLIFDESQDLIDMVYSRKNEIEITEWFIFVEEISKLVNFISVESYIKKLIFNNGELNEDIIDALSSYGKSDDKLKEEIISILTDKKTEVNLTLLTKLMSQFHIELEEYHLS